MNPRFGVFVPQGWRMDLTEIADPAQQFDAMIGVAKQADQGAFDSIWVYDHFHTVPEPTHNTVFEAWTTSAALARETSRIHVGQMVGCNGYRQPSLYAKTASTVDAMSKGRLYAGLGAGWYEQEWKAYGYEWTDIPTRMGRFREAVQIVHKMWTEDEPTFSGKSYSIDKPINKPMSGVPGRKIPLWIGGGGEKVTLKLAAQYADACNLGAGKPDVIAAKLDILRQHCENLGRDFDAITKSTSINVIPVENPSDTYIERATAQRGGQVQLDQVRTGYAIGEAAIREKIDKALEAGVDYVISYVPGVAYDDQLIPAFSEIISSYL